MNSPIAKRLAQIVTPGILAELEAQRPAILSRANIAERVAIKAGWPVIVQELPGMVEAAMEAAIEKLVG